MKKWINLCWNQIDWKRVEFRNGRLQRQIYNASFFGNQKKVLFLQSLLICSLDAKLFVVHNFETQDRYWGVNQGPTGADASLKFHLAQKLKLDQKGVVVDLTYKKKEHIEQKQKSKIIQDYMKQFWILMALEPQWKPLFESNSYGFRLGRNAHYTIKYLLNILASRSARHECFILKVNLRKCFNHIDHNYLLSKFHTPLIIKNQIQSWLKAGILTDLSLSKDAQFLGIALRPFLCHVALQGIEQNLKPKVKRLRLPFAPEDESLVISTPNDVSKLQQSSIQFVRYVDNFVMIHHDKEIVLAAKNEMFRWFKSNLGIEKKCLSIAEAIQSSREGFDFLGFRLMHIKSPAKTYRIKIYPSKKSQKKVIKKIGDFCRKNRSISTYHLISILSPIILNWANYFRFSECKAIFRKMDFVIFQILRAWVFRRDPRHGRMAIKPKYFPEGRTYIFDQRRYSDNWVLVGRQKLQNGKIDEKFLPKMAWVQSLKYADLKTSRANPLGRDTPLS